MRSDNNQLVIFDHDERAIAAKMVWASRESADEALKQYQFSASVRKQRHEHYMQLARHYEAIVEATGRAGGPRQEDLGKVG